MNIKFSIYSVLLSFLLPINGYSLYDQLAIDLRPTENELEFCFTPDYSNLDWQVYLAALIGNQLYFINAENQPAPWDGIQEPSFFIKKQLGLKTTCFPPLSKTLLQNIPVYVGIGSDFVDIATNTRYTRVFDGSFPTLPQPPRLWTVMVYIVGSNLESVPQHWASQDLMEMLNGTQSVANDAVNLVLTTGGSRREGWNTVKRSMVQTGQFHVLQDLGSQSLAAPHMLSDFVLWATTHFPAQHYALILWNHGDGVNGYGLDTSTAGQNSLLHLTDLQQAYQTIRSQLAQPLDIVVYDACLMASIEVAEVTATLANAMSASAELEPGHGIDYAHLLQTLQQTPPDSGVAFGQIVKTGYIQHSKDLGTFANSQITYSVLDLTKLPTVTDTLTEFATALNQIFTNSPFLSYEMLSHGIIRAPGYPFKDTGRFLRSLDQKRNVRVDLYNILQTVLPDFPELKTHADSLLTQLQTLVVDYETNDNVKGIDAQAGRISLDIGKDKSYLAVLPQAYTTLKGALDYYSQKRKSDDFKPSDHGDTCMNGIICGDAHWLNLTASELIGLEGYYGQQAKDSAEMSLYLVKTLLQYPHYPEDHNIGAEGKEACQYQLCINESQCENLTVKKQPMAAQRYQLLAEVQVNQSPAVLSFCGDEASWETDRQWAVCQMTPQTDEIWGRDDTLYPEDTVIPNTLHLQDQQLEVRQGNPLVVVNTDTVILKRHCDDAQSAVAVAYYGLNGQRQFDTLCNNKGLSNCFCQEKDFDPAPGGDEGCRKLNVKSGVYLSN